MKPHDSALAREQYAATHQREYRLFWALDDDGDGHVRKPDLTQALENNGLTRKDVRLVDFFSKLDGLESDVLDFPAFLDVVQPVGTLIERVLQGDLALPDFARFSARVEGLYREVEQNRDGTQATYIPPLAEVDPDQFALAIMSVDGQLLEFGKTETDFSVQSASKPFNYCFALDELGAERVHQHIGREPSGQPFNARVLLHDGTNRPHNPMVNAGAIMTAALTKTDWPLHRRLEYVRTVWSKMTGGSIPRLNAWMAQEESRTGDNNRALGYMMKAAGVLPKGEDAVDHDLRDALELYFSLCSLELNAHEMATAAATLANNGICPVSQERVFGEGTVRDCLTMMQMCGMYDGSGHFSVHIGVPAKSGVGGAVFLVVPRLMGVAVWSPRLDAVGNSVRGVELAQRLAETYRLHIYDGVAAKSGRINPRTSFARSRASVTSQALWAASSGEVRTLQRLVSDHADLGTGDYDLRTPMHLSAAEGHLDVVRFLLDHGVSPNTADRWGGTPIDDAELGGHSEVVELLRQHDAKHGDFHHVASDVQATLPAVDYGDTEAVVEFLWAASENDIEGLRRSVANGIPVSASDYDGRTTLHLAASDGQLEAVRYLLAHKHPIHVRDRWNSTPLDEAQRENRDAVVELLSSAIRNLHTTSLNADLAEIPTATDFVDQFAAAFGIDPLVSQMINVVLVDALSNIIAYGYDDAGGHQITLEFEMGSERLDLVVTDDGRARDLRSQPMPDTTADREESEIAGLTTALLRRCTDGVSYRRHDEKNILTLAFRLERLPEQRENRGMSSAIRPSGR